MCGACSEGGILVGKPERKVILRLRRKTRICGTSSFGTVTGSGEHRPSGSTKGEECLDY
jgi:hypothetical protein